MDPVYISHLLYGMGLKKDDGSRFDAGETMFVTRQLEHVMAQATQVDYAVLKSRLFIPVDTSVPNGAETFTYTQWDVLGEARLLANYGEDIPEVDAFCVQFNKPLKGIADGYSYSVQDLRAAQFGGVPLDAQKARAARMMIDRKIDRIAAKGDTLMGLDGFVNHSAVPVVAPVVGTWDAATTADEMIKDLDKLVNSIPVATKQTITPDTLLTATTAFVFLQKPVSDLVRESVLTSWLKNNYYIKNVDQWIELDDASALGGPRAVCYKRDPLVAELVISQEFEQFPPQADGLRFKIACHARTGGILMRKPKGIAYMDLDATP